MNSIYPVLCVCAAFLAGSVPCGFLIGRANGRDLRQEGSGNIGATNVWRVLGPRWGVLAFVLDFLKGFAPVWLAHHFIFPHDLSATTQLWLVGLALAAVLGHNYTPWLGFRGGKGIATSAGVLAALLPASLLVVVLVWVLIFWRTRLVSLASLSASVALPLATWFLYLHQIPFFTFALAAGGMSVWRHRGNIARLRNGTEPRMGAAKAK